MKEGLILNVKSFPVLEKMESPWESQRAEAENGELLSVEESDHEGERLVHKTTVETVKIHEGKKTS